MISGVTQKYELHIFFKSVLIKVLQLLFGDFIFKFHGDEVVTWRQYAESCPTVSLRITVESVGTPIRYKIILRYSVLIWIKDLSGIKPMTIQ